MKRIIALLISVVALAGTAHADACSNALTLAGFPGGQSVSMCKVLSTALRVSVLPNTDNAINLGSASKQFRSAYFGTGLFMPAGKAPTLTKGGAAATSGTFTCNGVTGVVVSTTSASASMVLAFSPNSISGTAAVGHPYVSAFTAATSFTVKCSVAGETSVYNWAMINLQ